MRIMGLPATPTPRALKRGTLGVEFVEHTRVPHRRLRIAHQYGSAGRGLLAADDPGMTELGIGSLRALWSGRRQAHFFYPGVDLLDPLVRDIFAADYRCFVVNHHACHGVPRTSGGVDRLGRSRRPFLAKNWAKCHQERTQSAGVQGSRTSPVS